MGGNLFKLGRKPRDEYLEIEADVRRVLDPLLGDGYRIPRYYASKPDFGDMDVVVRTESTAAAGGVEAFRAALCERLAITRTKSVGHVFSTAYRDLQVDYFTRPAAVFEATYHYLSFNDLGNIIGKICKRLGLKYGEDGLSYVFRRPSQPSYKQALLVSRDWPRILAFLGLDVPAWEAGFDTLEQMFAWVVRSPWFSVAPYDERDRDRTTERRARQRRTMARFVEWLAAEGVEQRCTYRPERDAYVPEIAAAFPEAGLPEALAHEREAEAEAIALREKWSGDLVRDWTGLEGKALGAFIRRFRQAHPAPELLALSPEAIRALVEGFPREDEHEHEHE
ncbi:MAG: hypothetical protein KDK70_24670 [Myxococcales bacterium]|nr:hypothetical protein [Myxococcales bacterium]